MQCLEKRWFLSMFPFWKCAFFISLAFFKAKTPFTKKRVTLHKGISRAAILISGNYLIGSAWGTFPTSNNPYVINIFNH